VVIRVMEAPLRSFGLDSAIQDSFRVVAHVLVCPPWAIILNIVDSYSTLVTDILVCLNFYSDFSWLNVRSSIYISGLCF